MKAMNKVLLFLVMIVFIIFAINIIFGSEKMDEAFPVNTATEVTQDGVVTALTANLIFIDIADEEIEFPRDKSELRVGDKVRVVMNQFKDGTKEILKVDAIAEPEDVESSEEIENEPSKEENADVIVEKPSKEDKNNKEEDSVQDVEEPKVTVNTANGVYYGLADSHSVELQVNDETNIYTFDEGLKEAFENLEETSTINFSYTEENGQMRIVSLNN